MRMRDSGRQQRKNYYVWLKYIGITQLICIVQSLTSNMYAENIIKAFVDPLWNVIEARFTVINDTI